MCRKSCTRTRGSPARFKASLKYGLTLDGSSGPPLASKPNRSQQAGFRLAVRLHVGATFSVFGSTTMSPLPTTFGR